MRKNKDKPISLEKSHKMWSEKDPTNRETERKNQKEENYFYKALKKAVENSGLSPKQIDKKAGLPEGRTMHYLTSKSLKWIDRRRPTRYAIEIYAKILSVTPQYLWPGYVSEAESSEVIGNITEDPEMIVMPVDPNLAEIVVEKAKNFAHNLEEALKKASISPDEFDRKYDYPVGPTMLYLRGLKPPTDRVIETYSKLLSIDPDSLMLRNKP